MLVNFERNEIWVVGVVFMLIFGNYDLRVWNNEVCE